MKREAKLKYHFKIEKTDIKEDIIQLLIFDDDSYACSVDDPKIFYSHHFKEKPGGESSLTKRTELTEFEEKLLSHTTNPKSVKEQLAEHDKKNKK